MIVKMVLSLTTVHLTLYLFETERVVKVFANSIPNRIAIFSAFKRAVFIAFFFNVYVNLLLLSAARFCNNNTKIDRVKARRKPILRPFQEV